MGLLWHPLIKVVIVIGFVLIPSLGFIYSIHSNSYFEKNFLAIDAGLVAETILASPYDVSFSYPEETWDLTIEIEETRFKAYEQTMIAGPPLASIGIYNFVKDPNINIVIREIAPFFDVIDNTITGKIPVRLIFKKEGTNVKIYNINEEILE